MPEDLFAQFISFSNLHQAFQKAKKLKNLRPEVLQFEYFLEENLD